MKRILILSIISLVLALIPASCVGQSKVFESVAKLPDVTSVYIGKAAMRMAGGAAVLSGEMAGSKAIKQINSIEIVTCENKKSISAAEAAAAKIIAGLNLEVIIESNEDKEKSVIYGATPAEGSDYIDNLLIYNVSPAELNIVYIDGRINVAELMKENQ